jgi:low temperature requirement protein LtrA
LGGRRRPSTCTARGETSWTRELGLEPDDELQRLERAILNHDRRRRRRSGRYPGRRRLVFVALLALGLSAALWWLYFRDEDAVEHAMKTAEEARRARLALVGFGYWHDGLLLGMVSFAAGLKKAISDPYDPLDGWIGVELGVGVALFVWSTVGFSRTLGLGTSVPRLVADGVALATIPLGTEWTAAAEFAALMAIVVASLVIERTTGVRPLRL